MKMFRPAEAALVSDGSLGGHARPAVGAAVPFAAAILAGEMGLVTGTGALVVATWARIYPGVGLPGAGAMAAAYGLMVLASGAWAQPPRRARHTAALRVLGAVFLVGLLGHGARAGAVAPMVVWGAFAAACIACWRSAAMRLGKALPALTPPRRRMAFIGNSEAAARMLDQMQADPHSRLLPIGFFDDRADRVGPLHGRLEFLGPIAQLVGYIHDHDLQDVFVALPWSAGERIAQVIDRLRFLPLAVRLIPDQSVPALRQRNVHQLEGVAMPTLMLPPFSHAGAAAKRAFDLVAAVLLLVPLAPLLLVVAAAIRLESPGSVLFMQRRSGQFGRSFDIFKFRSLYVERADAGCEVQVSRGDSRVTRVGKYLRKYSIDELPQIFNVLLGHMSLVGPRPHAPRAKADGRIYAEVMPDYMLRYRVKPGMTGWAQVNGWRGNTDTEEKLRRRVEFDFDYIRNWSLLRDVVILVRTVPSTLFPPLDNV